MAYKTRSSVLAIKEESTEGTAVAPAAATDFIALQEGFDMEPAFEEQENNELRSSIGVPKKILGTERPTATFSHYLRHSGVEGTAPNYAALLKSVWGSTNANGTQRTTTTGSTTSQVNLGAGGSDFSRGRAILVKDPTNGYSIRPVHSVSSNNLTLGFNLANAPATGVGVGKCVSYEPANSGHPSLSLWLYNSNEAAAQLITGARVAEMSIDVNAGEMINASFSLRGIKHHMNPITITSSTRYLDFVDDVTTRAAAVTAQVYRDPHELASALAAAMNALGSSNTFSVTFNDSGANAGKFTIASTGSTLELLFATGGNTANTIATKLGFTVADETGALTYNSDSAQSYVSPYTPSYDSADPLVAKSNEVLLGDAADTSCFCASRMTFTLSAEVTPVPCICSDSGVQGHVVNRREFKVDIVGLLDKHDVEKFKRFRANDETRFCFNFGEKSGGNWVAGKCASLYVPSCTISSFKIGDQDGLVVMEMTLTGFVDSSGNGEVYLNFL